MPHHRASLIRYHTSASKKENNKDTSPKTLHALTLRARCELRIAILRALKGGVAVRDLEISLADSPLQRWFCFIVSFDRIKAPAKSTIDQKTLSIYQPAVKTHKFPNLPHPDFLFALGEIRFRPHPHRAAS